MSDNVNHPNRYNKDVEKLIKKELEAATERFGLHHSWHEKYAVMMEKLQELREEVNLTDKEIDSVWFGIRNNLPDYAEDRIHHVYERAVKAACKAIQVAAMAKKGIDREVDNGTAEISDNVRYSGKDSVRVCYCDTCKNGFSYGGRQHPRFCPECGVEFTKVLRF